MSTPSFVVRVLLLGAVGGSYALTCLGGSASAAPHGSVHLGSHPRAAADVPAAQTATARVEAPVAPAAPAPMSAMARFPGGYSFRALNGIVESVDMPWPTDYPWSPVTEVVHDRGQDWYRHADGSWSTTTIDPSDAHHAIGLVFTPAVVRAAALRGH